MSNDNKYFLFEDTQEEADEDNKQIMVFVLKKCGGQGDDPQGSDDSDRHMILKRTTTYALDDDDSQLQNRMGIYKFELNFTFNVSESNIFT